MTEMPRSGSQMSLGKFLRKSSRENEQVFVFRVEVRSVRSRYTVGLVKHRVCAIKLKGTSTLKSAVLVLPGRLLIKATRDRLALGRLRPARGRSCRRNVLLLP